MTARTLVIIPAYNEEESLPAVLKELAEQTPDYDVLVVSDGSTDRTADVAREAGAHVPILPFNLGIGGALRTGFAYAVRQRLRTRGAVRRRRPARPARRCSRCSTGSTAAPTW